VLDVFECSYFSIIWDVTLRELTLGELFISWVSNSFVGESFLEFVFSYLSNILDEIYILFWGIKLVELN